MCPRLQVLPYTQPFDLDFVYQETLSNHPDYDFSPYMKFGGIANTHTISAALINLIVMGSAALAPCLGFRWRSQTLATLDRFRNSLSAQTIMQFRALVQVGF
uniref:ABC transmembrane type-1 domain-containing protein n=1 Tax=Caenorhabditis tropicalis TaxID=1561998 RepID=A0A1I7T1L0_9PELO